MRHGIRIAARERQGQATRQTATTRSSSSVVAVRLQPAHHRVLGVEDQVHRPVGAGLEGTVVADLVGARAAVVAVQPSVGAGPTVLIVGLPGGIRGLKEQLGFAIVVANDEVDVAVRAARAARWPNDPAPTPRRRAATPAAARRGPAGCCRPATPRAGADRQEHANTRSSPGSGPGPTGRRGSDRGALRPAQSSSTGHAP